MRHEQPKPKLEDDEQFRTVIDSTSLKEIKCKNYRYTWSNERAVPTLLSIDKLFCMVSWELLFPSFMLMAASKNCSDHCPLLLANAADPPRRAKFRFEAFWPHFPHFRESVDRAWARPVNHDCAFSKLSINMERTTKDLKTWSKSLFSDAKL